ncbi:augmin subunit 1 [Tanacetum coccineum]
MDFNPRVEFAHRMALISYDIYKSAVENFGGDYVNTAKANSLCLNSLQRYEEIAVLVQRASLVTCLHCCNVELVAISIELMPSLLSEEKAYYHQLKMILSSWRIRHLQAMRTLAQLENGVAPCEAQMESWKTNLSIMVSKERQSLQQYSNYKVLNAANNTPIDGEGQQSRKITCTNSKRVTILTCKFGQPKGFAYVEFVELEAVKNAVLLNKLELHGRQLNLYPKELTTVIAIDAKGMEIEIDLSNLGTVNTMFATLFSDEQAQSGIFVRVTSAAQSKFKLLYFDQDNGGGYSIALQTKNCADRAGLVSAGEKEICGNVPSVSKVGPPKFELQMGCKMLLLLVKLSIARGAMQGINLIFGFYILTECDLCCCPFETSFATSMWLYKVREFESGFGYDDGSYPIKPMYTPVITYNNEVLQLRLAHRASFISSKHNLNTCSTFKVLIDTQRTNDETNNA